MPRSKVHLRSDVIRALVGLRKLPRERLYEILGSHDDEASAAKKKIGGRTPVDLNEAAVLAEALGVGTCELLGSSEDRERDSLENELVPGLRFQSLLSSRWAKLLPDELVNRALSIAGAYLEHIGGRWPSRGFVATQRSPAVRPHRFVRLRVRRSTEDPIGLPSDGTSGEAQTSVREIDWLELWGRRSGTRLPAYSLRLATFEWNRVTGHVLAVPHFSAGTFECSAPGDELHVAVFVHPNGAREDGDVIDEWMLAASFDPSVTLYDDVSDLDATSIAALPCTIVLPQAPHQRARYERPALCQGKKSARSQ